MSALPRCAPSRADPMRIGIVFHKDPYAPPSGIDLVRLRAIALGLIRRGIAAEVVSPVRVEGVIDGCIPVYPLDVLAEKGRYHLVKTCYHYSMELIARYDGPVVSRIVRVVDEKLPERDEPFRQRLLRCQEMIRERSAALALNNRENERRWRHIYGQRPRIVLTPTGCPSEIPLLGKRPYDPGERVMLFLGSLAAERMVVLLNRAAKRLKGRCTVHFVGLNKARMYGSEAPCPLGPLIVDHGEIPQDAVWDYIRHADIGLALATGPYPFDNDVSKILNYLRGGLPVLSEQPIVNNGLIGLTGLGKTFRYDSLSDLVKNSLEILENPLDRKRSEVMRFMAQKHSWERRIDTYTDLFTRLVGGS